MIEVSLVIGTLGLLLILAAFALNLFHFLSQRSVSYNLMNIFGSGFLAYYSWFLHSVPFTILQIVWGVLSIFKLIHVLTLGRGKK